MRKIAIIALAILPAALAVYSMDIRKPDNLGNHTATENLKMDGHWVSNDGDDEGVMVNTDGNVGIGADPQEKLEVAVDSATAIFITDSVDGNRVRMRLGEVGTEGAFIGLYDDGELLKTRISGYGSSYFNAGNVGIGTTTPMQLLEARSDGNSTTGMHIVNTQNGVAAASQLLATASSGSVVLMAAAYDYLLGGQSNFSNRASLFTSGLDGLDIVGGGATADVRLYSGGVLPANERMRILSGGNVGIATTAPAGLFTVGDGTMVVTSSGRVGINEPAPSVALEVNGETYLQGQLDMNSNQIDNVTNMNADSVDVDSITATSGHPLYIATHAYFGGNVGINGVTSPQTPLHINGGTSGGVRIATSGASGDTDYLSFYHNGTNSYVVSNAGHVVLTPASDQVSIYRSGGAQRLSIYNNSNEAIRFLSNGDSYITSELGLNEDTPDARLEVVNTLMVSAAAAGNGDLFEVESTGNVGIGDNDSDAKLEVKADSSRGPSDYIVLVSSQDDTTELLVVQGDGNVGINTVAPSEKLEITDGSIKISTGSGSQGVIFQDNSEQIIAFAPVIASSEPAHNPSIASTNFVGIATATIVNRGSRPLVFKFWTSLQNGSGAARTYTIDLRRGGVQIHTHDHLNSGNSDSIVSYFNYEPSSVTGSQEYSLWIKSSNAVGAQTANDTHLFVHEF